jgi:hypothetical protein
MDIERWATAIVMTLRLKLYSPCPSTPRLVRLGVPPTSTIFYKGPLIPVAAGAGPAGIACAVPNAG